MRGRAVFHAVGCWAALACGGVPAAPAAGDAALELAILHTSDLHSRVLPFRERISALEADLGLGRAGALSEVGGFARLASVLERERQAGADVWLDSGDALEGAEIFERSRGRVEIELLGALGLSALALGNHELSLSGDELSTLLGAAPFPVLAANLDVGEGSPLARVLRPSVILSAGGMRLGVVGVANPGSPPHLKSAGNPWGLAPWSDSAAAVQAALDELRPRVDLVVVVSHLGLDADRELLRGTSGIDLLLGGHQHFVTLDPIWQDDCQTPAVRRAAACAPRSVPVVHSAAYGKLVTRVELTLQPFRTAVDGLEVSSVRLRHLPLSAAQPERADVLQLLEALRPAARPPLAFLPRGLARRSALGGDSPLGNFTADAAREAAGADVALLNGSGLRGDLESGVLLESDLRLALPFAEPWRVVLLRGRELRRALERGARRSALRGCESALQVSGLELVIGCEACRRGAEGCLSISKRDRFGLRRLVDDELVSVALPTYLTLPQADFEAAGGVAGQETAPVVEALLQRLAGLPSTGGEAGAACAAAVVGLGPERCREAFGPACPVSPGAARAICRRLPVIHGGRDDRVRIEP